MPRISIGDCQLYYERHGAGFPVLFVSGLGGYASYWREQIPAFTREFDMIMHDQRGVGQSDSTRMAYTVEGNAADVIALMDALEIPKAHVIGHATGGAVAQVLAIEHPDRLASIVLAASWARPDPFLRRLFTFRKDLVTKLGHEAYILASNLTLYPPAWIAKNNEKLRQQEAQALTRFAPLEIIVSRIDALLAFDRSEELAKVRTPTLVVAAEDDFCAPAYFSEELTRIIPGAEAKFFPHGGHCFTQIVPREFNQAVLPFLAQHTPS